jgi:acyl carrier protein phosphodiesterase
MNFLAHIYLSGDNHKVIVGNFIGDFVKGNQINDYDPEIKKGIELHREIDHFTDNHSIVRESKDRLRPEFRHYSAVIVDVFYDHFLAKNWLNYSQIPLIEFTKNFYEMIETYKTKTPDGVNHMLQYMKRDNWLYHYHLLEGIHRALSGMARRTKFESKMEHATKYLEDYFDEFGNEFDRFFPDLQKHCADFLHSYK